MERSCQLVILGLCRSYVHFILLAYFEQGRLENASVDVKHAIFLSQTSHLTELVIRQYYAAVGHSGTSHIWPEIRQRFSIVKGGAVVRNSIGRCILCKKKRNSTVGR